MDSATAPILQAQDLHIGYRPGAGKVVTVAGPLQLRICPGQLICLVSWDLTEPVNRL